MTRYPVIRFHQFADGDQDDDLLYLFAAPASAIAAWAGIPRKGWRVRMLYQRWVTQVASERLRRSGTTLGVTFQRAIATCSGRRHSRSQPRGSRMCLAKESPSTITGLYDSGLRIRCAEQGSRCSTGDD